MKKPFGKNAWTRIAASILAAIFTSSSSYPDWWIERGIVKDGVQMDDYAACNHGQLKNFALGLAAELSSKGMEGGLGEEIDQMISSWNSNTAADDYAVVNLGQLKAVALPFYRRMHAAGIISEMPIWLNSFELPENNVAANIGQLKNVFYITSLSSMASSTQSGEGQSTSEAENVSPPSTMNMAADLNAHEKLRFPGLSADHQSGQELVHDATARLVRVGAADVLPRQIISMDEEANILGIVTFNE